MMMCLFYLWLALSVTSIKQELILKYLLLTIIQNFFTRRMYLNFDKFI